MRPVKTRPSVTRSSAAPVRPRRSLTRPLNQAKLSSMRASWASMAPGATGLVTLGSAFRGALFTSVMSTPSLSRSPVTFGIWATTPIEPVSVLPRATMWSAASAAM